MERNWVSPPISRQTLPVLRQLQERNVNLLYQPSVLHILPSLKLAKIRMSQLILQLNFRPHVNPLTRIETILIIELPLVINIKIRLVDTKCAMVTQFKRWPLTLKRLCLLSKKQWLQCEFSMWRVCTMSTLADSRRLKSLKSTRTKRLLEKEDSAFRHQHLLALKEVSLILQ